MPRRLFVLLIFVALLSIAAEKRGSMPWKNQQVYGWAIMTKDERRVFRVEMSRRKTYDEKLELWRSHVDKMQQRAWDRGLALAPAPEIRPPETREFRRPIWGAHLMTGEEIEAYRTAERALESKDEERAFRLEHEKKMIQRANQRGLTHEKTKAELDAEKRETRAKARAERERAERRSASQR